MTKHLGAMILMALLSTSLNAAQSGLPAFVVPDCLGVNIHFTGTEREQVDKIADGGFKFIRMDFVWVDIEKKNGEYDFKAYDELVDSLATKGIRALFILDYGNPLYDKGAAPNTDEGRAAFAKFAAAGAAHFAGRGVLWELWNEPNGGFWRPQANVEDYVKWAKTVYPALKKADPGCTVLAPALAGWDLGFLENVFKLGLLEAADVVSLHPYGSGKPEDAAILYGKARELIGKYAPKGREYPLVSGEWGYSSCNKGVPVETQADYIARQFLSNMANGVRLSIWYDWRDDGPDPNENEHRFGTVAQDMSDKPAYVAAKTLTTELKGYAFANRIRTGPDDDYLALFRKGGDYRLAAWTTGEPHAVTLPLDVKEVEIVSRSGQRTKTEVKDGKLELKLTGSPQYVEPKGKSLRWAVEAGWNIEVTTALGDSGLYLKVDSTISGVTAGSTEITMSGDGVREGGLRQTVGEEGGKPVAIGDDAKMRSSVSTAYEYSGHTKPIVTVTLLLQGMTEPIVRVVEVGTSACHRVEVLPPMGKEIPITIHRPATGAKNAFTGKLVLGNADGIALEADSIPITLAPGQDKVTVRVKTKQPASAFAFACSLVDERGHNVVRMPARRYVVVETFADGKPGANVLKYGVAYDGDAKVSAQAKLTYVKAPEGAPSDVCAKLDYSFGAGWKFIRVFHDGLIPIEDKPVAVKIWVKGDGGHGVGRLRMADAGRETFQPEFGTLNFTDWRCVEADMTGANAGHWGGKNTGRITYPIKWETLFLLDNVGGRETKGTIYLGPAMLYYD